MVKWLRALLISDRKNFQKEQKTSLLECVEDPARTVSSIKRPDHIVTWTITVRNKESIGGTNR